VVGAHDQSLSEVHTPQGLLYVEVDCPPELEGEFHAWYNQEHIPERSRIPGFVSARRYAALEGSPRWLAAYELTSLAVLESPEYCQWLGGPLQTAWTTRMISSTKIHRAVFRLASRTHGTATPDRVSGLLAVRYEALPADREQLSRWHDFEFSPALLAAVGVVSSARYESPDGPEQLGLYELEQPWVVQDACFARVWTGGWDSRRDSLAHSRRALYMRIL
jgi:hypothetical protein